ncbi:MAG TPA: hypothetical protein VMV72_19010 [Verrucomicrobiae bacterium]|nr:hypothetical protein [Verrucomicrobiae bacterium]
MAPAAKRQLALDANVPLDLADKNKRVIQFHAEFLKRGYELWIAPTALQEIHLLSERGNERQRHLALIALQNMLRWRIVPFNLIAVGHGLTARFAEILIDRKLLPESECNDGMILAETALLEIPVLITSDHHLLQIDETSLKIAFDDCGLAHVAPVHPVRLFQALR